MRANTFKIIFTAALIAFPASAQKQEADTFRLTMPRVEATVSAYSNLIEVLASDASLAEKFKQTKKSLPDSNGRDTMSLVAQQLATDEPRIAAVFKRAGITPKDAGMTMECLVGIILGDAMLQSANAKTDALPTFVTENLAFYRQNKDAVQNAFKRFTTVSAKAAAVFGEKEDEE